MDKRLERILPRVQKPARYTGGEYNAVKKDPAQVDTRIAFCFPDTYEIGMSNLGMRILYGVMNNMDGVWCQRVFAPWGDMEEEMRKAQIPLFALESGEALTNFDIVAFSVGYEMAFSSLLNMLDLAGIPLHSADRTGLTPLVVAGGTRSPLPTLWTSSAWVRERMLRWSLLSCTERPGEKGGVKRNSSVELPGCQVCMCPACIRWRITPMAP